MLLRGRADALLHNPFVESCSDWCFSNDVSASARLFTSRLRVDQPYAPHDCSVKWACELVTDAFKIERSVRGACERHQTYAVAAGDVAHLQRELVRCAPHCQQSLTGLGSASSDAAS